MFQLLLESVNQAFILIVGVLGYWFLWVSPAIHIGHSLVERTNKKPVDWLPVLLHFLIFIIFAFPTILMFVLAIRYFKF
jgi:hypothetical protein